MRLRRLLSVLAVAMAAAGCDDDGSSDDETTPPTEDAIEADAELPDPCEFAPAGEVSTAVGTVVDESGFGGSGDFDGVLTETCSYGGGGLNVSVQVLGGFDAPAGVREAFAPFGDVEDADIEGLPDSTFVTDVRGARSVFVVEAQQPFGVGVSSGTGDGLQDRPEETEALALALYEPA